MWWNRDNPNELFDCCIIDPEYPFGERPSWKPNTDSWIFAPREGIDQIAARLTAHSEAEPQLSRSAIEVDSTELDSAAPHAQSAPEQPETQSPTESPRVEEEAEQQRSPLFVPNEFQRKWLPKEAPTWFRKVRDKYSQMRRETKSAYADRLYDYMKNDFDNPPWGGAETLRRRLNDRDYA